MARKYDIITSFEELKNRYIMYSSDFLNFGVKDLSCVRVFNDIMYLYFIDLNGNETDRLRYKIKVGSGVYEGDHVISGATLNEIYRDIEFMYINYLFGFIY